MKSPTSCGAKSPAKSSDVPFEPIGKMALDRRGVIRFGLARMAAPTVRALDDELSWERFFDVESG